MSDSEGTAVRTGVVVVCRLNSTRLEKKALLDLHGVPAIERCLLNATGSELADVVVLATSTHEDDEELVEHDLNGAVQVFRGSEEDVADRIVRVGEEYDLDVIVRVTGDSPLISYELIDYLVECHRSEEADYSFLGDAPLGTRPDVISREALTKLKSLTDTEGYSEYLALYFKNNPDVFRVNSVSAPERYRFPDYRLNLDYPEDYEVLQRIFRGLGAGRERVPLASVISFLEENPDVLELNQNVTPKYAQGKLAKRINEATTIER